MSSNDFNGSERPARGRGADADKYPEPEGWGQDGFWRDPSIDSDYETGTTSAIRPRRSGGSDSGTPGYSYWADGKGWENAPGSPPHGSAAERPDGQRRARRRIAAVQRATARLAAAPVTGRRLQVWWRPDGVLRARAAGRRPGGPAARWPWRPWWSRRPPAGRSWRARRAPRPQQRQGQGQLVAPLDVEEGGRPRRRDGRPGDPAGRRRLLLRLQQRHDPDAARRQRPRSELNRLLQRRQDAHRHDRPDRPADCSLTARSRCGCRTRCSRPRTAASGPRAAFPPPASCARPTTTSRAAAANLSGGSTITQEFVRQYYSNIGTQQTVSRKIKEIFIAQKLAKSKSKQWILTNYLNTIYLGDNSYGISAAAETYFGVPVNKLTVAAGGGHRGDHPAAELLTRCRSTGRASRPAGTTC